MEWQFACLLPQVKLVARAFTNETPKSILCQINGERAACRPRRTVQWTRATKLVAISVGRFKLQKIQDAGDWNVASQSGIIDAWHVALPHREEEPVTSPHSLYFQVYLTGPAAPFFLTFRESGN
jgi:hypothetical protein